ncbi:large-conductance mechanosensitive channel protein MscL [Entomobacter blattae]|uniref:Large-conductance mechanosensitive channel n=1 Tax=Entomobacter blattae TaxID=2762277 RepID=A0A7H1NS18_9PROT|nr:large-conductance mechanosensitive channel protein MscL [Entomobacter blattae]QNT78578.1 Large-conductance mechanosensitive channel [Entomobacter blattae]
MNELEKKSPLSKWILEFRKFLLRGNVVDLAVGVIIGAAFTGIVNSLVKDVFTPLIGLLIGGIDFSNLFITLRGGHFATLEEAKAAGAVTMNVGLFLNALIQFLIIGFVIFWVVKLISKLYSSKEAEAEPTKTETLLENIRDILAKK